jgi:hypothetical protein
MELDALTLNEISQALKDKYPLILTHVWHLKMLISWKLKTGEDRQREEWRRVDQWVHRHNLKKERMSAVLLHSAVNYR